MIKPWTFQEKNMTTLLVIWQFAIGHGTEFVDLPIKNGDYVIVHSFFP